MARTATQEPGENRGMGMARFVSVLILLALSAMPAIAAESFSLRDTAGRLHVLDAYKGKWVLVNFWATWCPPCLEEIPDFIALHEKRKDMVVIGVALEYQSKKEVMDFVDDNLMSYPIVLGDEKTVRQFGSADVLPTTFIYDPQGNLVKMHRGLISRRTLEKLTAGK
jgi:thiol-disulfide isomerase/thioredoxin